VKLSPDAQPVAVEWLDASASSGWCALADLDLEPTIATSVGWLLPAGAMPGHVVVVGSLTRDEFVGHCDRIPVGMVRRITSLVNGATLPIEPAPR
jgi:hypothetical protein